MTSISPVSGATYFGYTPSVAAAAATSSAPASSSAGAAPTAWAPSAGSTVDQVELANLSLESQWATSLFGAPASDSTATAAFFSNASMLSLLSSQSSAVLGYLNSQSAASSAPPSPSIDAVA